MYENGLDYSHGGCNVPGVQSTHFTNFGLAELIVEVKRTPRGDCFTDEPDAPDFINIKFDEPQPKDAFTNEEKERVLMLGQHIHYAGLLLGRQFRKHLFTMFLCGTWVRFCRWERAGTIVSKAFNCQQDPGPLCEFLWRLEHATLEQRGHDTTVAKLTDLGLSTTFSQNLKESLCFQHGIEPDDNSGRAEKLLASHFDREQLTVISGPIDISGKARAYCVSKPIAIPLSVACRGTRGFWAMDVNSKEIRFLKDTWRMNIDGLDQEGDTVQVLLKAQVRNVPDLDWHGDVMDPGDPKCEFIRF